MRCKLEELDRLSTMLDGRFRIPGTNVRFGWDSLLDLIPGVGDKATLPPSSYLIYRGHKLGARKRTVARIATKTGLDFFLGSVPVPGDLFDFAFKVNNRNVALLKSELSRPGVREEA